MAGLCEGGNEPPGSLKANCLDCGLGVNTASPLKILIARNSLRQFISKTFTEINKSFHVICKIALIDKAVTCEHIQVFKNW
ncbi:hypothetical protein ANN_08599 [Periplaneta americana]|uniref:Uncharacterized protein n=1 Tax=Periplaneta americana TaxID=6978 RepID=A0ABQ8T1W6_PERAM|nr:hypothetical protein ANN_08599 [Periplaneta americana]